MNKADFVKIRKSILKVFWILVIGSVFGFVVELLYGLAYTRTLQIRQGLIYGPFIQVYGMGALAYYFLVKKVQDPKKIFFIGMILGGVLEYICSFGQEVFFKSVSWDYSDLFLNVNGRTSLIYCIYWGIIGVFFLKVVYPAFEKLEKYLENKKLRLFSYFFMIFMIFDVTISCMAASRQTQRQNNIPPKNSVDIFLDNAYPDQYLDKIYNNKKSIESLEKNNK